jgi:peroxiredoxin
MHNPFVPETLEGWSVLHLMFRIDWGRLRETEPGDRQQMAEETSAALAVNDPAEGATTLVQLLGHKGDLMVIAFRKSFDDLGRVQLALSRTQLHSYLEPTNSYVSIVELGMYDMTAKIHRQLADKGLQLSSEEYQQGFDEEMERQRQRVAVKPITGTASRSRDVPR